MKPLDFYNFALELSAVADTETRQRSVISRLYYGLHHEACCRLFREHRWTQPLSSRGRHTELVNRFRRLSGTSASGVARLLRSLSRMRNEADYQLRMPLRHSGQSYDAAELMSKAIVVSRQLLAALEAFSPGEAPDGCECRVAYVSG